MCLERRLAHVRCLVVRIRVEVGGVRGGRAAQARVLACGHHYAYQEHAERRHHEEHIVREGLQAPAVDLGQRILRPSEEDGMCRDDAIQCLRLLHGQPVVCQGLGVQDTNAAPRLHAGPVRAATEVRGRGRAAVLADGPEVVGLRQGHGAVRGHGGHAVDRALLEVPRLHEVKLVVGRKVDDPCIHQVLAQLTSSVHLMYDLQVLDGIVRPREGRVV
mmetsp:Transcript_82736/g.210484  ORF Transcript_82736/g.210484 Transcript_82736/m.210484 type:complete len:217 (+) Transcript_82736:99-749(+)